MTLTLAQTETLKALVILGRQDFHTLSDIVRARITVRFGDHTDHFEKHWKLMSTKTIEKLRELKVQGIVRSRKGDEEAGAVWTLTVKGEKAAKDLR